MLYKQDRLLALRREFHQCAELGFFEWQTFDKIASIVKETTANIETLEPELAFSAAQIRPDVQFFKSREIKEAPLPFLKATFKLGKTGANLCFRCDIDALPIVEAADSCHLPQVLGFRSCRNMHACGHDGHMAITLSLLLAVNANQDLLKDRGIASIAFLFQSAEEGCSGAMLLIDSKLLKNIDDLYCFHLGMGLKTGFISPNPTNFLATLKFSLTFTGLSAHAGRPSLGINALKPLCKTINDALDLIDEKNLRLINFSNVECQGVPNIIPDLCLCKGELRAGSDDVLVLMRQKLLAIIKNSGASPSSQSGAAGLKYDFKIIGRGATVTQDQRLVDKVRSSAIKLKLQIVENFQFNASEDASLLIAKVKELGGAGCYLCIGADIKAPHHNERFDFDEQALIDGYKLLWGVIESYLKA